MLSISVAKGLLSKGTLALGKACMMCVVSSEYAKHVVNVLDVRIVGIPANNMFWRTWARCTA